MALRRRRTNLHSWLRPIRWEGEIQARQLPVDVDVESDRVVIRAHLPGFTADEIDVRATQREVTIGTHRAPPSTPGQRVTHEVYQGNWFRRIRLAQPVRPDLALVTYENGELTICLPRAMPARSIVLNLPGSQVFERPEIPMRTSADVSPPGPGPHDTVFKP
ncbi:MAG TPA: Hsp20/alpha crystallin family protein [Chloroflexota bacterium]|nr:Hsp20/alpha crystallin family protein [Chloroflexota bacterium]